MVSDLTTQKHPESSETLMALDVHYVASDVYDPFDSWIHPQRRICRITVEIQLLESIVCKNPGSAGRRLVPPLPDQVELWPSYHIAASTSFC